MLDPSTTILANLPGLLPDLEALYKKRGPCCL